MWVMQHPGHKESVTEGTRESVDVQDTTKEAFDGSRETSCITVGHLAY